MPDPRRTGIKGYGACFWVCIRSSDLWWPPRHSCLVIDRMHEETGENGNDRAAGRANRRL